MKRAAYVLLFAIAGCSQGRCRGDATTTPAPGVSAAPLATAAPDRAGERDTLRAELDRLRRGGHKKAAQPPDEQEQRAYEAWVTAAAIAARDGGPPPKAAPRGFKLIPLPDHNLWILAERTKRRRGAGALTLRVKKAAPLLVETPHTFFDEGTLGIAVSVFAAQEARALLINTVHRHGGKRAGGGGEGGGGGGGEGSGGGAQGDDAEIQAAAALSDVAHAERSFFLAAHRALLQAAPGAPTVQIHGFKDSSAPGAAAIVSAIGPDADPLRLLRPLRAALPDDALLAYPAETLQLGGEQNMQRRLSHRLRAPFYHLEMSRALRDKLAGDPDLLQRFAAGFQGVAGALP